MAPQAIKTAGTHGFNLLETIPEAEIAATDHPKLVKFTQIEQKFRAK